VIAVSKLLGERGVKARIRVIGGPSNWSDYTKLLDGLPRENAEYGGRIPPAKMSAELQAADVVLLASKYDPCPMSVLEALASGVPVVATDEVGSIEDIDRAVVTAVHVSDVPAMANAIEAMLSRVQADHMKIRAMARAEAERRFARDVVCEQISAALVRLVGEPPVHAAPADTPAFVAPRER
jgi:glycosyltransferase involved in cell wall biosynthesis